MTRKLHRCPACREYFNTTSAVMVDHYHVKHQRAFEKAAKIAELVVKRAMFTMQAEAAPWPMLVQYETMAVMAQAQLEMVAAQLV